MSTAKTMKPCPYCGESIIATAVKCRFCGEFIEEEGQAPRTSSSGADDAVQFIVPINVSGWSLVACYAGFIGMCLPLVGLLFSVPAVICGIIALTRRPKGTTYGGITGNIRAVLGLIFGSIGILAWGGMLLFLLLGWAGVFD